MLLNLGSEGGEVLEMVLKSAWLGPHKHLAHLNILSFRARDEAWWMRFHPDGASAQALDRLRRVLHTRAYAAKTEQAYCRWVERFLKFVGAIPIETIGMAHVERFLDHLTERDLAAKSRNQAASALTFFFGRCWVSRISTPFLGLDNPRPCPRCCPLERSSACSLSCLGSIGSSG